jgi:hypothetical protein
MNVTNQSNASSSVREFERWIDPETGQEFVLVPTEQYEMIRAVVDGITRRAGWDDPALDVYEQFRKQK